jgi:hypothetical protein
MLIPIPIGARYVAAVWKFIDCSHCQRRFAYLLELEATGETHGPLFFDGQGTAELAHAQAEQTFLLKSRTLVVPVPCPNCGMYQDDMSRKLKEETSINTFQIIVVTDLHFASHNQCVVRDCSV